MAGGQRLISWLHPCSTSNVALNMRTCTHGPLMGHPNWAGCDTYGFYRREVDYEGLNGVVTTMIYHMIRNVEGIHKLASLRSTLTLNMQL
jgi:hypothetical protein